MAISNSTFMNDLVGTVVNSEALSAAYAARVMRKLVYSVQVPGGAQSIVVPSFSGIAVASLTEGTAPSSTTWETGGTTLTPLERGVYAQISKHVLYADPFSDLSPYGTELGRSLADDEDGIIAAEFANFTASDVTASGTVLTKGHMLSGIAVLEANNTPGPYFGVFHPKAWASLRESLGDASVNAEVGKKIVEGLGVGFTNLNGYVGAPFGVPCFISTKVPTAGSTYCNAIFGKTAVGYAYMQDIAVDVFDNVTARAFDLMAWYAGDAGTLRAEYGIQIYGASTT